MAVSISTHEHRKRECTNIPNIPTPTGESSNIRSYSPLEMYRDMYVYKSQASERDRKIKTMSD